MDKAELELKYNEITELFDLAEELVETVESEFVKDPNDQLELIEPLVEAVGDSADLLSEEFLQVAGKGKSSNKKRKSLIEGALRKIYIAIDEYSNKVNASRQKMSDKLMNIADPVVEKIKRQVEVIIAAFIDFVDLSLDSIMQKTHLDALKQRQEKISSMLFHAGYAME